NAHRMGADGASLRGRWDSPGGCAERGYMRRNARWLLRPTRATAPIAARSCSGGDNVLGSTVAW
ncbi:MAG: hypothetical protein Q7U24_00535, partial [Sulfurimicrobium sp.]|nr:hypothetical protein [Sulfurimicrobium sp.]